MQTGLLYLLGRLASEQATGINVNSWEPSCATRHFTEPKKLSTRSTLDQRISLVPTMIFNGYREQVEGLYANLGITDPRALYY